VRARGALLALWTVATAMRAEGQSPDWFDAFRGKAYVQGDASFVAREKSAAPDAPPAFRARWVVLRYAAFTERERPWWPHRNLLLVSMPSGQRFVVESSLGFLDEDHLDEERPWQRVASERTAFEVWASGTAGEATADPGDPCAGMRYEIRATGGTATIFLEDLGSRTLRASLSEIASATFTEEERKDLVSILRLSFDKNPSLPSDPNMNVRYAALGLVVAFRDHVLSPEKRTLVLAPDPAPPGDLTAWRGLANLPLDLPPFPALAPPENPIR